MREVEILYDNILNMFEENSDLTPKDIVVMAPDIEKYAPYIKAVFDNNSIRKIPFSIADRSFRSESKAIEYYIKIIELAESRFSSLAVLSVLESTFISKKFEIRQRYFF